MSLCLVLLLGHIAIVARSYNHYCQFYDENHLSEQLENINIINQSMDIRLNIPFVCGYDCNYNNLTTTTTHYRSICNSKSCDLLRIGDGRNSSYLSLFINSTINKYVVRINDDYLEMQSFHIMFGNLIIIIHITYFCTL